MKINKRNSDKEKISINRKRLLLESKQFIERHPFPIDLDDLKYIMKWIGVIILYFIAEKVMYLIGEKEFLNNASETTLIGTQLITMVMLILIVLAIHSFVMLLKEIAISCKKVWKVEKEYWRQ